ncbi:MAG: DNA gyrase/topoisomerase IV subunit A [Bacteroidetes bacterium]|jgi:topoisomerase-4 subunit A|nr:DNA gyrase/topoisomerase IV subunit A [Bacteroidota bacterium]
MDENEELDDKLEQSPEEKVIKVDLEDGQRAVKGMYEDWFLDYASYVILERAVPHINDGLKPVQRRFLHAMKEMDDGRYNKVANVIGSTMQYHPHGDAAIGGAIINMGQKDLLIDCQGNWGDVRTGDSAAAPRYIEARLNKFANAVAFNKQTTEWQKSYDGRKNEPITLPVKFPLLLAQGVEGIAVGLSTKIMPHNFVELVKGSIKLLEGKKPIIYPDFQTGGQVDVSDYQDGRRGGRIKVRATIVEKDKNTLAITDVPYGTTTGSLIDSILKANDKGKIKIKKVVDNTAKDVEVEIQLPNNISTDKTIDALYAFTNCETSISPNACVIVNDKPRFMGVSEILEVNTENTVQLLRSELEIKRSELEEKWHFSSLEKIFIEERIYRDIEEEETWEGVLSAIDKGLKPHIKHLKREVTEEDIIRLTEIKIKRISKFDTFKADELLKGIEDSLAEVNNHLDHLTEYAIAYYQDLLNKFGKEKGRKTEIKDFEEINTKVVAVANEKLYANLAEGFVGTGIKKEEYICDCSDIDDIVVFRKDGTYSVSRVSAKAFFGKNIIHIAVFRKNDDRLTYNAIYTDGASKKTMAKRFNVLSITRDKEYNVTKGTEGSKLHYFTANPNGEAEIVNVYLHSAAKARTKLFDYNFADLAIKGRGSQGNLVSKHPVRKIDLKEKGVSTIGGRDIWYEPGIGRLNLHERGEYLGSFQTDDQILVIYQGGEYEITNHELTNHYANKEISIIEKYDLGKSISVLHFDGNNKNYCVKRFKIETSTNDKRFSFITEGRGSKMILATTQVTPIIELTTKNKTGEKKMEEVNLVEFIDVKGWKSIGNKLCGKEFVKAKLLPPPPPNEDPQPTPPSEDDGAGNDVPAPEADNSLKEIPDEAVPKLPSKDKADNRDSFTSGDQISLL